MPAYSNGPEQSAAETLKGYPVIKLYGEGKWNKII